MKTPDDLEKLATLLDDENEDVAVNVIAAMLERQDELGDLPARLQEHPDELVRRRAHQLQAAITFRNWRREFFGLLNQENPDFMFTNCKSLINEKEVAAICNCAFPLHYRKLSSETIHSAVLFPEPESGRVPPKYG